MSFPVTTTHAVLDEVFGWMFIARYFLGQERRDEAMMFLVSPRGKAGFSLRTGIMPKIKKRGGPGERAFVWITTAVALVAANILDSESEPHRWHAAIAWTVGALSGVLIWCREKWNSFGYTFRSTNSLR